MLLFEVPCGRQLLLGACDRPRIIGLSGRRMPSLMAEVTICLSMVVNMSLRGSKDCGLAQQLLLIILA